MDDKIKEKVEEIHEGIQFLKNRADFDALNHKDRLWEVESAINQYRDHDKIEGLRHALSIFWDTNIAAAEGADAYDVTIWDANVQARGKMTALDDLFHDLQDLIEKS